MTMIFCLSKTHENQHLEFASVFHQNCTKKYIERTPIFRPSKLSQKKYIDMT